MKQTKKNKIKKKIEKKNRSNAQKKTILFQSLPVEL